VGSGRGPVLDHSSDVWLGHRFEALLDLDAVIESVKVCISVAVESRG
jgi:hypothetical protein